MSREGEHFGELWGNFPFILLQYMMTWWC